MMNDVVAWFDSLRSSFSTNQDQMMPEDAAKVLGEENVFPLTAYKEVLGIA